ncbi:MAG: hypothetical protein KKE64_07355, partial [Candidatus Omnitrophica bacterium]|nr:hypothetical protein [Candidatus Omnitrophota bacterium]
FIPLEPLNIAGPKLQKEDIPNKRYLFLLANSWYPGEKYLVKYGIREGAVLKCEINIINRGTCSPVLFRFTDLNTTDYFESQ